MDFLSSTELEKVLAMPDGLQKDLLLVKMLDERTRAVHFAASNDGCATPLESFSKRNGVRTEYAENVIASVDRYINGNDINFFDSAILANSVTFSRNEAIDVVVDAFKDFDAAMADRVKQAAAEGRVSFEAPAFGLGAHQGWVGVTEFAPDDIKNLPPYLKGKPYACAPVAGEHVTIKDIYSLAHECAHLAAAELYGSKGNTESLALTETYSAFGELLAQDHLRKKFSGNRDVMLEIEHAYNAGVRTNMFVLGKRSMREKYVSDAYIKHKESSSAYPVVSKLKKNHKANKEAYDVALRDCVTSQFTPNMLDMDEYKGLEYTLAQIGARQWYARFKQGEKDLPARLDKVIAKHLSFGEAMAYTGVNIESPKALDGVLRNFELERDVFKGEFRSKLVDRIKAERMIEQVDAHEQRLGFDYASSALGGKAHNVKLPTPKDLHR